jgi:hypothetical protein
LAAALALAVFVGGAAQRARAEEPAEPSEKSSARIVADSSSDQTTSVAKPSDSGSVTTDERGGLFGQFLDTLDGFYDQDRSASNEQKPAASSSGRIVMLQQPDSVKADEVASSKPAERSTTGTRRSTTDKSSSNGGLLGSFFGKDGDEEQPTIPTPPAPLYGASPRSTGQQPASSGNRRPAPSDGRSMAQQNQPKESWMKKLWPFARNDAPETRPRTAERPQTAARPAERPQTVARPVERPQTAARSRVSEPVAQTRSAPTPYSEPMRRVRERTARVRPSLEPNVAIEFAPAAELAPEPEIDAQLAKSDVSERFESAPTPSSVSVREPTPADITPIDDETHTIRVATGRPVEEKRTPTLAEEYAKTEIRVASPPDRTDQVASPRCDAPLLPSEYASVPFESSVDALGLAQSMNEFQRRLARKPSTSETSGRAEVRTAKQPGMVR